MLHQLLQYLGAHETADIVGLAWFISALVTALPDPDAPKEPLGVMLYRYFYTVSHNLVNALPAKYRPPVAPPRAPEHL